MITMAPYTVTDKERWNHHVGRAKNRLFMFDRNFMDYHADRFCDCSQLFFDDDELLAVLPASLHGREVRSHGGLTYGGFITNAKMKQSKMNACFAVLCEGLKKKGIHRFIYKTIPYIYHHLPSDEDLYALFLHGATLLRRDVSSTLDLTRQPKMTKGRKAQAVRARREGVVIEETVDVNTFIQLINHVLAHHQAKAVHTAAELELLRLRFPTNIKLFAAKKGDVWLAATLIFEYDHLVHTQYMAANDLGRELGALDFLLVTLIEQYGAQIKYFDFGTSSGAGGCCLNHGLCAQKEGFGGRSVMCDTYALDLA
jgi:hypothetical protein